ncbi:MAG: hypothetical protein AB1468_03745 [Candidatus Micrarchaeota archaeon]
MERILYLGLFAVFLALAALLFGIGLLVDHNINTSEATGGGSATSYLLFGKGAAAGKSLEMVVFVLGAVFLFSALFVYVLFMSTHRPRKPDMYARWKSEDEEESEEEI